MVENSAIYQTRTQSIFTRWTHTPARILVSTSCNTNVSCTSSAFDIRTMLIFIGFMNWILSNTTNKWKISHFCHKSVVISTIGTDEMLWKRHLIMSYERTTDVKCQMLKRWINQIWCFFCLDFPAFHSIVQLHLHICDSNIGIVRYLRYGDAVIS